MKKTKKLLVLMLIATMLLTFGCASNNAEENNANASNNEANENATSNATEVNPFADLDLEYSKGLDEKGFFENVTATDVVELAAYKGISVPNEVHAITEETVQANIDSIVSEYATSTEVKDRAIVDGDTVNIDYVGSIDGVEFEGGNTGGAGTEVTIGVTSYIDDFLEQLIGHTPGESFDIEVTFPEDYGNTDLAGSDAVFAITVNFISETEIPELTDEFVNENLFELYETSTVEAFRTFVAERLHENAVKGYVNDFVVANSVVSEIPESVLEFQKTALVNYYTMSALSYGMSVDEFLQAYVGYQDVDSLVAASTEQLSTTGEYVLVMQAIAEDAGLEVTEDDLVAYFVENNGSEDYSEFEDIYGKPYLKNSILQQTILDYLVANAELAE